MCGGRQRGARGAGSGEGGHQAQPARAGASGPSRRMDPRPHACSGPERAALRRLAPMTAVPPRREPAREVRRLGQPVARISRAFCFPCHCAPGGGGWGVGTSTVQQRSSHGPCLLGSTTARAQTSSLQGPREAQCALGLVRVQIKERAWPAGLREARE